MVFHLYKNYPSCYVCEVTDTELVYVCVRGDKLMCVCEVKICTCISECQKLIRECV
jgi:hypothetical protein